MAQRYTNPVAFQRMLNGCCPECGRPVDEHTGWGAANCSLTDNGVADRIHQFEQDQKRARLRDQKWEYVQPIGGGNTDVYRCLSENCGALCRAPRRDGHDDAFHADEVAV